ncbi:OVARIAN TUMOR DOMAIN-containing deubiquitinating enzyme 7-like isoform X2 [Primulina tabacum]
MSPRWYIQNFDMHAVRMIHLSYHDGEHYNSLRSEDDDCSGPAKPIVIKGDADLSAKSKQPKVAATKSKHDGVGKVMRVESIALVKYGSGCGDTSKLEQALKEARGDVDAAIENLTAEQESVDQQISHDELSHSVKNSCGNIRAIFSMPLLISSFLIFVVHLEYCIPSEGITEDYMFVYSH